MTGVKYKDIKTLVETFGWIVLPTKRGEKAPYVKWEKYRTEAPSVKTIQRFFSDNNVGGAWLLTGPSKVAVLDVDTEEAHQWWEERIGEAMARTARVRTGKGWHYYFDVPPELIGSPELKDRTHQKENLPEHEKWDFRGQGGVILPPTWHVAAERAYTWDDADMRPVPSMGDPIGVSVEELLAVFQSTAFKKSARITQASTDGFDIGNTIAAFQKMGNGDGRNSAFKDIAMSVVRKVSGDVGYARMLLRPVYDGLEDKTDFTWEEDCEKAIGTAFRKYTDSLIVTPVPGRTTTNNPSIITAASSITGFLVPNVSNELMVEVPQRGGGQAFGLEVWSNFDIRATGVVLKNGMRTYIVDIYLNTGEVFKDLPLPADTITSRQGLETFFLSHKAYIYHLPKKRGSFNDSVRLGLYLNAQNPTEFYSTDYLGVQQGSDGSEYLTHEGVITKNGLQPFGRIKLAPNVASANAAPYQYQFGGTMKEAMIALAEVLTLHDWRATAVYGARFASLLHKADLMERGGLGMFPICGLEAPSGSGKTSGFFGFMNELSGCTVPPMVATPAVIRNRMASHRNVDVFIDDKNLPIKEAAAMQEIFRNATQEGSMMKMDTRDNATTMEMLIIGSALHAGEGLGIRREKALLDRYIMLNLKRPTGRLTVRKDKKNGDYQEQDVQEMRTRNLRQYSGWIVQRALQCRLPTDELRRLLNSLSVQKSRQGNKTLSLRYGVRVLLHMFEILKEEDGRWCYEVTASGAGELLDMLEELVDEWCNNSDANYDDNANVLDEFLADALAMLHHETEPLFGSGSELPTAMFVAPCKKWMGEQVIHFRFDYLVSWYKRNRAFESDARVRNITALKQQLEHSYEREYVVVPLRFRGAAQSLGSVRWIAISPKMTDRLYRLAELEVIPRGLESAEALPRR